MSAEKQGSSGRGKQAMTDMTELARRQHELHSRWKDFKSRDIQQEQLESKARQDMLIERFGSEREAAGKPMDAYSLRVCAKQRALLELFAQWRMLLPTKGLHEHADRLISRGFYFRWEQDQPLTPTLFPDSWKIVLPEPATTNTEHAYLVDQDDVAQLGIFYRLSEWDDTINPSYVYAIS